MCIRVYDARRSQILAALRFELRIIERRAFLGALYIQACVTVAKK